MKKRLLSILLTLCMLVSLASGAFAYSDTADHWGESAIDRWSGYGVVSGDGDGTFAPGRSLNRAEAAQIFVNLLGLTESADISGFSDVPEGKWYADAVSKCVAAGILTGMGDGTLAPTATVTREQYFVMFARSLGFTPAESANKSFSDSGKVASWAEGYINALINAGVVNGNGDGTLAPDSELNRASAVTVLSNAISTYVNKAGEYDVTGTGLVLINTDGEVALKGDLAGSIVVAPGSANAELDLADATVSGSISVLADSVSLTNVPEGTTVTIDESADGVSVNGAEVEAGSSATAEAEKTTTNTNTNTVVPAAPTYATQEVTLRPAGPATGGKTDFDYAAAYEAAGITLDGSSIKYDGSVLLAYLNDETNNDTVADLIHTLGGTDYLFVGLAYTAPDGAAQVVIDDDDAIDLTVDSDDVYDGKFIEYYGVAKKVDGTWTLLGTKTFSDSYIKWLDESGSQIGKTAKLTVSRVDDVDEQAVEIRGAGPATSGKTDFDYAAAYEAAGITLDGTTLKYNAVDLAAYLNANASEAIVTDLVHTISGTDYLFVGLAYTAPDGAKSVSVDGETVALTVDSDSVRDGKFIEYYGVAEKVDGTWVALGTKTFSDSYIKWLDENNEQIGKTAKLTVSREDTTPTQAVEIRGAGPATGDVENFDYAAKYEAAGITLEASVIKYDGTALETYLNNTDNTDDVAKLIHENVIYVGLVYTAPANAASVSIDGGEKIDLTKDSDDVYNGKYINYFSVAEKASDESGKWVARATATYTAHTVTWYDADGNQIGESLRTGVSRENTASEE
jgi:hypothetical protein